MAFAHEGIGVKHLTTLCDNMAHIAVHKTGMQLDQPILVEGLPGVGLVGKIVVDHLVDSFGMTHFATVRCPGLPSVATYREGDRTIRRPVRIYADPERNLLALQSDVPVSPSAVADFASCLTGWLADHQATGLYVSGTPADVATGSERRLTGVETPAITGLLERYGIGPPVDDGIWSGPTGALLNQAVDMELPAVGVIVESDPNLPDPEAACTVLEDATAPIATIPVDADALREHAEEIRAEHEAFARQMNQPTQDESSRAEPMRMYW